MLNPAIKTSGPSPVGMWVQPRFGFINQNATIGHSVRRNLTAATKSCQTSNVNALQYTVVLLWELEICQWSWVLYLSSVK